MLEDQRRLLRRQMRAQRAALAPMVRMAAAEGLLAQMNALAQWSSQQQIAGYWAVGGEILLHRMAAACARRGAQWLLPRLDGDRLRFAPWTLGDALLPNRYGIPEPVVALRKCLTADALQLVLLPVLAFDRAGNRLGSGAGYYDRSLAFLGEGDRPREPLLVGVAYAFQEVEALPAQEWDVGLDFVCTERELIDCTVARQTR